MLDALRCRQAQLTSPSRTVSSSYHRAAELTLAVAAVGALLLLAACSSAAPTSISEPPAPVQVASAADDAPADQPDPRIFRAHGNCTIIDPAIDAATQERHALSLPIVSEVHAGLTRIAEVDGAAEVVADLMQDYSVADGATEYRITLKRDLRFSDGSPIRATDFKWSWERALKASFPGGAARGVLGSIDGAHAMLAGDSDELRGLQVLDDRTFIVQLRQPVSNFVLRLADPVAAVLKRDNVAKWRITFRNSASPAEAITDDVFVDPHAFTADGVPVGAGPFRSVAYSPYVIHRNCVLEPNPYYFSPPQGLDFVVFADPYEGLDDDGVDAHELAVAAYHRDAIDYMVIDEALAESIAQGDGAVEGTVRRYRSSPSTMFAMINPAVPPFDDIDVRRAFIAAADVETMFEPWPLNWRRSIVPSGLSQRADANLAAVYDPERAQRLMQGRPELRDGKPPVRLAVATDQREFDRIRTLLRRWREILDYPVSIGPNTRNSASWPSSSAAPAMVLVDIYPTYPDLDAIFSKLRGIFGEEPAAHEIATLEAMIDAATRATDQAERANLYREVEAYMHDHALAVPLITSWGGPYTVTKPWVDGFELPTYPGSAFRNVEVSPDAPLRTLPAD